MVDTSREKSMGRLVFLAALLIACAPVASQEVRNYSIYKCVQSSGSEPTRYSARPIEGWTCSISPPPKTQPPEGWRQILLEDENELFVRDEVNRAGPKVSVWIMISSPRPQSFDGERPHKSTRSLYQ